MEEEKKVIKLSSDDILNFQPAIDYKGYSARQVDQFLDDVMNDYDTFNEEIASLKADNEAKDNEISALKSRIEEMEEYLNVTKNNLEDAKMDNEKARAEAFQLKEQLDVLRQENISVKKELEDAKKEAETKVTKEASLGDTQEISPFANGTTVDILRRVARLEAAVFGAKKI